MDGRKREQALNITHSDRSEWACIPPQYASVEAGPALIGRAREDQSGRALGLEGKCRKHPERISAGWSALLFCANRHARQARRACCGRIRASGGVASLGARERGWLLCNTPIGLAGRSSSLLAGLRGSRSKRLWLAAYYRTGHKADGCHRS